MICQKCGWSMDDSYTFCTHCGAKLGPPAVKGQRPAAECSGASGQTYPVSAPASFMQEAVKPDQSAPRRSPLIMILVILLIASVIFTALLALGIISFSGSDVVTDVSPDPYAAVSPSPPAPTAEIISEAQDTQNYILPDSDKRPLSESELAALSWEQLCLARNEIFARHGLIFGVQEIDGHFLTKSWYTPTSGYDVFSFDALSDTEKANASMMYDYEIAHFGRTYY